MKILIFLITWLLCGILGFRLIIRLDVKDDDGYVDIEYESGEIDTIFILFVLGGYITFVLVIVPYIFSRIKKRLSASECLKKLRHKFYKIILGKDIVE